jgi:hypothetical protein
MPADRLSRDAMSCRPQGRNGYGKAWTGRKNRQCALFRNCGCTRSTQTFRGIIIIIIIIIVIPLWPNRLRKHVPAAIVTSDNSSVKTFPRQWRVVGVVVF